MEKSGDRSPSRRHDARPVRHHDFSRLPIAFTLIALGVFFGYYAMGDHVFPLLVQRAFGVMSNDVLIAVPLFLFMGTWSSAPISSIGFSTACRYLRNTYRVLAVATLATCALFATATVSSAPS